VTTDESGKSVTEYVYRDGTTVIYNDEKGVVEQIYPGANYVFGTNTINAPVDARNQVIAGQQLNPGQQQTYTDPRTGIIYTTGGTTGAHITNTISGTTGAAGGAYIGYGVNQALNGTFLGKSVIGQAVSATISGAIGLETGRRINNGLQPILNGITGSISQGWDSVAGSIRNVTGSWFGDGKYNPASPTNNILSRVYDGEGGYIITDRTGSVTFTDGAGKITGYGPQTAVSGSNWFGLGSGPAGVNTDTRAGFPGQWTDGSGNPILTGYGDPVYGGGYNPNFSIGSVGDVPGPLYGIDNNPINVTPTLTLDQAQAEYYDPGYWT